MKRQVRQPKRQTQPPGRRSGIAGQGLGRAVTTAIAATALAATTVAVDAPAAQAAIPDVAQTWSSFMWHSLTVTTTGAQLRQTLAVQRSTVRIRTGELTRATTAYAVAGKRVTAATAAETAAQTRVAAARQALTVARKKLKGVKPRRKAAITRARRAVVAAEKTLLLRRAQAHDAATARAVANASVAAAAKAMKSADNAVKAASAAALVTQRKIGSLRTPAQLAARAAALSRSVVAAVRPGFTVADTTQVYGTTVHRSIAFAFRRMVDDAGRAGIVISGGGFRTKQRQIELRKINGCPDVWTAPASSCRVPTAIPGRSLHEIGMAIDITSGGRTLTAKSPAFKWLKIHAVEYGLVNLPSEPWHWSITGG